MTDKLTKALEFANYRTTLNVQHNNMKARTQTLLSYSLNGGTFNITEQLISFVDVLLRKDHDSAVLLDSFNNPIHISDLNEFHENIISRYFEAVNEYYADYSKLKKSRKVHKLVDISDDN